MIYIFESFEDYLELFPQEGLEISIRTYPLDAMNIVVPKSEENVFFVGNNEAYKKLCDILPEITMEMSLNSVGMTGIFLVVSRKQKRIYRIKTKQTINYIHDRVSEIYDARKKAKNTKF